MLLHSKIKGSCFIVETVRHMSQKQYTIAIRLNSTITLGTHKKVIVLQKKVKVKVVL